MGWGLFVDRSVSMPFKPISFINTLPGGRGKQEDEMPDPKKSPRTGEDVEEVTDMNIRHADKLLNAHFENKRRQKKDHPSDASEKQTEHDGTGE